jgi:hypothetical protein
MRLEIFAKKSGAVAFLFFLAKGMCWLALMGVAATGVLTL